MRIAVLTFHRAYNCGAMLQAWALKVALQKMGHEVFFPRCNHVGETGRWELPWFNHEKTGLAWCRSFAWRALTNIMSIPSRDIMRYRFRRFRRRYLPECDCLPAELNRLFELVVIGSDQVWNPNHGYLDAPLFFAEKLPAALRKISYSASYGDEPLVGETLERAKACVRRLSAISVRERLAQEQLQGVGGISVEVTVDPTLLIQVSDYGEIPDRVLVRGDYLFMYTLYVTPFFLNTAKSLARALGVKCVVATCCQYSRFQAPSGLTYGVSPDRLVQYVRHAKYVLAGSFHGTVMGVLFDKPFLSLRGQVDAHESRPASLLRMLGCSERLVDPTCCSLGEMVQMLRKSPGSAVQERLRELREGSVTWLKKAVGVGTCSPS